MSSTLANRLARPGLARLWDELIRRWGSSGKPVSSVTLRDLTDAERHAIADLLGTDRLPKATCSITTLRITESLDVTVEALKSALAELRGAWGDRAAERAARAREREDLWAWVATEARWLGVAGFGERVRARGVSGGDAAAFRTRLASVFAVLERLPATDVPLAGFACDVLGDPHALDHGSWLSSLVLEAIAERHGVPLASSAEEARRLWSLSGVSADGLSSSVLCLGLVPDGEDPLSQFIRACSFAGEPVVVTVSSLQKWPVETTTPVAYAFENPSILAEAARSGWRGPPVVCTAGWPNVAAITLLRQLAARGVSVRYHGDFDAKGLCIAQMLVDRLGIEPWRMRVEDYEDGIPNARVPLLGEIPDVSWDVRLAASMRAHRLIVFEEDVRQDLLSQIRSP